MKSLIALAVSLLLFACSAAAPPVADCNVPEGMPDARILLFGEMHGSVESPELVGRAVCGFAHQGPTALALEIATEEQPAFERYLASDGEAGARSALLQRDFWQAPHDGRSSVATLALIERVRELKQRGLPVEILTFIPPEDDRAGLDHEAAMAQAIRDFHARNPRTRIVALMGNVHAGQAPLEGPDYRVEPTGYFLTDLDPVSIFIANPAGSIWACMEDCGIQQLPLMWAKGRPVGFTDDTPRPGYNVSYVLPSITASPPAIGIDGD